MDTLTGTFEVLHALKVKGLANDAFLAAMTGLSGDGLATTIATLTGDGLAVRRENPRMSGTMLTAAGKAAYDELFTQNPLDAATRAAVDGIYSAFLPVNSDFKRVCASWQMVTDDTPNDHSDTKYDGRVIADLGVIHERIIDVLAPSADATDGALARLANGRELPEPVELRKRSLNQFQMHAAPGHMRIARAERLTQPGNRQPDFRRHAQLVRVQHASAVAPGQKLRVALHIDDEAVPAKRTVLVERGDAVDQLHVGTFGQAELVLDRREDGARRHAVAPNALPAELHRQALHQAAAVGMQHVGIVEDGRLGDAAEALVALGGHLPRTLLLADVDRDAGAG